MSDPAAITAGGLQAGIVEFVDRCSTPGAPGRFRFTPRASQSTLYSSTYAAMALDLVGALDDLGDATRQTWITHINDHQDEDGLFRDPLIFNEGWFEDDPLWCGRPHLTLHAITALRCLGGRPRRRIAWLEQFTDQAALRTWLADRDWASRPAWVGNEVMNVGCLLQYERDAHDDRRAGEAVVALLDWLEHHWLNRDTGMWGGLDVEDPVDRSHLVQAAYHLWPIFAFDGREIPARRAAVTTVLATQNERGGFGWGVHNAERPAWSSACEDIDSIEPLVRHGLGDATLAVGVRRAL
jgi:hypothetical protein